MLCRHRLPPALLAPLLLLLLAAALSPVRGLSAGRPQTISRATFFRDAAASATASTAFSLASLVSSQPANAAAAEAPSQLKPKLTNVSDDELRKIVTADVKERQFLVTADLTREVYDESSNFIDEIDVSFRQYCTR